MALKQAGMELNGFNLTSLTLTAGVGESILVKDVMVLGGSVTWAKIMIDRQAVGYFMCEGMPVGSHLGSSNILGWRRMIELMRERFGFPGYPVGEGQEFSIQLIGGTGSISILYDLYDAGDITPNSENGTASDTLLYVAYGSIPAAQVTTAGEYGINYSYMPAEFSDFPFVQPVPGGTEIDLLAIGFSTRARADGTSSNNVSFTRQLKAIRNREVLFSETKEGLICFDNSVGNATALFVGGGLCRYGDLTTKSYRLPFILDEPMTFRAGDELLLYWVTGATTTPGRLFRDDLVVSLILRMRRV